MEALGALGINVGYLLIQILSFVILMTALVGWLYRPILNVLEQRKQRIAKGLEDARQAAIARENADAEARRILDEARAEASTVRRDAVVQAEQAAKDIDARAREEARGILANAQTAAVEERDRILSELRSQVAAISIAAANKLVGESLDEQRQRQLIGDFFAKVPSGVGALRGDRAEVTSALPLSDAEKANARQALNVSEINFRVDPSILGGLVVRVGDRVVDDSVASRMSAMEDALRR
jgi:F-type H+-transporting ATPase subunit b